MCNPIENDQIWLAGTKNSNKNEQTKDEQLIASRIEQQRLRDYIALLEQEILKYTGPSE